MSSETSESTLAIRPSEPSAQSGKPAVPMSDTDQYTATTSSSPFRFLDLPKEVQSKIIETTLTMERQAFRPNQPPDDPPDTSSPRIYDFNINAFGMRSHTLPPLGLLFVNKEVSGDALAVVYQNSSFAVYAEISRVGSLDNAFGCIPKMVKHISPMVKENAREVIFKISTINEGPKMYSDSPATHNHPTALRQALGHLRVLLNQATFPHVKTLNIVLMTHGLVQQHLNIIFKLFAATGCIITLEEVCGSLGTQNGADQQDKTTFGGMVELAAKEWGQDWVLTEQPTEESTFGRGVWRAQQVAWVRYRKWNRVFAKPGPILEPFHRLYY